jgi:hypothetical protein
MILRSHAPVLAAIRVAVADPSVEVSIVLKATRGGDVRGLERGARAVGLLKPFRCPGHHVLAPDEVQER